MVTARNTANKFDLGLKPIEATTLLRADHRAVNELFKEYESSRSQAKKRTIVSKICKELTIHAQIEEEIFYPQVMSAIKEKDLISEAVVEHETLKYLIAQIIEAQDDVLFDARVSVLSEYVKHHVKEEHSEIFPAVKESKLDLFVLGEQLFLRKQELMKAFKE